MEVQLWGAIGVGGVFVEQQLQSLYQIKGVSPTSNLLSPNTGSPLPPPPHPFIED